MMNRELMIARLLEEVRGLKQRVHELEACAERDPLTGILNRRGFERELERIIADGTRAALIYLDLDDFKSINDRNGHAAGDAVLRQVATTLCRNLRASDSVARLGGDEFAVLLRNMTERGATVRAAALKGAIPATVPVSTGVATFRPGEKAALVLARADAVMYTLKRERRGLLASGASVV